MGLRLVGVCGLMVGLMGCAANVPVAVPPMAPTNTAGTLMVGSTLYPRAVRLANGSIVASTNGVIFKSTDAGATFAKVGTVPVPAGSTERCCATLYLMPQAVGALKAGTLVSAASDFLGTVPAIEISVSTDGGETWTYSSTPVTRGDAKHGLWEPQFEVAEDGALVMFWSDETDPCCSQKLAQARSYDGVTWQDEQNTVASTIQADRPGMATVSKLPSGHFFMSYELCGPAACTVFDRVSTDGWGFGAAADMGTKVVSTTGQYLEHAPLNAWSAKGELLLVGQVLYEANGTVSASNGRVLFTNAAVDGAGAWSVVAAPVQVPTSYDNYCPNYSSALLPSVDGGTVLELASYYNAAGVCLTYAGSGAD